ncbi:MAG: DUF2510 domain-containing protein [Solirubrobacterales bacterium]
MDLTNLTLLQGLALGWTASFLLFLLVYYPLIIYPMMRRRFRAGRRVEYTAYDGRVRFGAIAETPGLGIGLWPKTPVRIQSDDGDLLEVPTKSVKPLRVGAESGADRVVGDTGSDVAQSSTPQRVQWDRLAEGTPPGWYPSPDPDYEGYWDGSQWTRRRLPASTP